MNSTVTALFKKLLARHSPRRNDAQGPFQLLAPFMAYGSFRNCTRQNHGIAGNHEAGSFVNNGVSYWLFPAEWYKMPPAGTTLRHHSPIHGFTDFQELHQSNHGMAWNCEAGGFVNSTVRQFMFSK